MVTLAHGGGGWGEKFPEMLKMPVKAKLAAKGGQVRAARGRRVRFELYGEEIVEKQVTASGKSGRVYLPMDWLGKRVKIIRVD